MRKQRLSVQNILVFVPLVLGSSTIAIAQTASFQGLGAMGYASHVTAGQIVVGTSGFPVRWEAGSLQQISNSFGGAHASSEDGTVIAGAAEVPGAGTFPFRWISSSGVELLGDAPGLAFGTSASGDIVVGYRTTSLGTEGFRWTTTGMVGLGDLPGGTFFSEARAVSADGSVVVGASKSQHGYEAIRWTEAEGIVPLWNAVGTSRYDRAVDVSADGSVIVGYVGPSSGAYQAFRWTADDGLVLLGNLPSGDRSKAYAVSEDGSIVGGGSLYDAAFIWNEEHGMQNLQELLTSNLGLDLAGWHLWSVQGIATTVDEVYFAGNGRNPLGQDEAFLATIPKSALMPEPGCLAMLGILPLMLVRRRRRVEVSGPSSSPGDKATMVLIQSCPVCLVPMSLRIWAVAESISTPIAHRVTC